MASSGKTKGYTALPNDSSDNLLIRASVEEPERQTMLPAPHTHTLPDIPDSRAGFLIGTVIRIMGIVAGLVAMPLIIAGSQRVVGGIVCSVPLELASLALNLYHLLKGRFPSRYFRFQVCEHCGNAPYASLKSKASTRWRRRTIALDLLVGTLTMVLSIVLIALANEDLRRRGYYFHWRSFIPDLVIAGGSFALYQSLLHFVVLIPFVTNIRVSFEKAERAITLSTSHDLESQMGYRSSSPKNNEN